MSKYAIGAAVRINRHGLREHDSVGTVVAIDRDRGFFEVSLKRVQPPFRGLYQADELARVVAENLAPVCPQCQKGDVIRRHAPPTFALPECDFWECEECSYQWGHR